MGIRIERGSKEELFFATKTIIASSYVMFQLLHILKISPHFDTEREEREPGMREMVRTWSRF